MSTLHDVLIVDDNELDRELVRRLLPIGTPVREAATAEEARAHLTRALPDLVLLDNRLPDADGVDILPLFAERHVPVVMLTEVGAPEVIVVAMQRGAEDYIVKGTLTREGLQRAASNAVEKAALRRRLHEQHEALAHQAHTLGVRNREVQSLAAALTCAEQAERDRIAGVLHDDLQQRLYGLLIVLPLFRSAPGPDATGALVDQASKILDGAIQATRTLVTEMSPTILQADRLRDVLDFLASEKRAEHGLEVEVEVRGDPAVSDRPVRVALYQAVREALFNVVKHSGVTAARLVAWEGEGEVVVRVEDDGAGFDPAAGRPRGPGGLGLFSARERLELVGGRFEVESAPGRGAQATVAVPSAGAVPGSP